MTTEFDKLWDYDHPDETEKRFRELIPELQCNEPILLEVMTQIARTQGLQKRFDDAHGTLDDVERRLTPGLKRAQVRYLLERGRVFNSSGDREAARPLFEDAWDLAQEAGEDALAVDAAHMIAIVEPPDRQMDWNLRALALAESSADPKARRWRGSLLNNIGWTYHDAGEYERALEKFEEALQTRMEQGATGPIRIARWCVARCLRSLGRNEEALAIQRELHAEHQAAGTDDRFVQEELAILTSA